jgi:disulfide bond formation protein DsbB
MFTTSRNQIPGHSRFSYFSAFLCVCVLIGVTYYLQIFANFNPCPLCILQRITLMALGIIFFFGALLRLEKSGKLTLSVLAYLLALIGALLAARQVWIQHLPPNASPDCGASLEYMLQALPLLQVLQHILSGGTECSLVNWTFLGLSLAEWSLISFCGFLFFTGYLFLTALRAPRDRFY